MAYCQWLSEQTGKEYRLPTEAEWEKAARGTYGQVYAWGNDWDPANCNSKESGPGDTTPVGQYSPQGDSPYGCADMLGNVWEWTSSALKDYPYNPDDGREGENAEYRILRGGSWYNSKEFVRCAYRNRSLPGSGSTSGVFVAVAPRLLHPVLTPDCCVLDAGFLFF